MKSFTNYQSLLNRLYKTHRRRWQTKFISDNFYKENLCTFTSKVIYTCKKQFKLEFRKNIFTVLKCKIMILVWSSYIVIFVYYAFTHITISIPSLFKCVKSKLFYRIYCQFNLILHFVVSLYFKNLFFMLLFMISSMLSHNKN